MSYYENISSDEFELLMHLECSIENIGLNVSSGELKSNKDIHDESKRTVISILSKIKKLSHIIDKIDIEKYKNDE